MNYVCYDLASGNITRFGRCCESDLQHQPADGEGVLSVDLEACARTHHVVDGQVTAYTPEQCAAKADADLAQWDNTTMVDPLALQRSKRRHANWLTGEAKDAANAILTVLGVSFEVSPEIRATLAQELALAQAEGAGYSLEWERADNTAITLTGVQVRGLLRAISNRDQSIRATLREKLAAVLAATTTAEVEAIVWT